jgi:hypothetical protein
MRELCDAAYTVQRDLIEARVANARLAASVSAAVAAGLGADVKQVELPDADKEIAAFDEQLRAEPQDEDPARRDLLKALGLR